MEDFTMISTESHMLNPHIQSANE